MDSFVKEIVNTVEPIQHSIYGPMYRCSLTLKDGTFLPCALLQSKQRLVELAKRRIREEINRKTIRQDLFFASVCSSVVRWTKSSVAFSGLVGNIAILNDRGVFRNDVGDRAGW